MTSRPVLSVAVAFALVGGCAGEPEPPGPPTPERVQRCLSERDGLSNVEAIAPGRPQFSSVTPEQGRALTAALKPSQAALSARSGGPYEKDGVISEAPVGLTELHFFNEEAEAQDVALAVEPVVGAPDESVLNGVRALGPVVVLHYSFGMGDSPGGVGIEEDLEPVEACLREAEYLQG